MAHITWPLRLRASSTRGRLRRRLDAGLSLTSRLGYAARGLVYLTMGGIALAAALDLTPRAEGAVGSLKAWGDWPFGLALLTALGCGLWAFAGWRGLQALFNAEGHDRDLKGWLSRAGEALSGVTYGLMGASVLELADELADLRQPDDEADAHATAQSILSLPHGDWLLIAFGLTILAFGVGNIVRAAVEDFAENLRCSPDVCRWVTPVARIGYAGRGAAALPLAVFVIVAGLDYRAEEMRSFGGALQALEAQPFGSAVLTVLALGLMAFGAFALVEARYRAIHIPEAVKP